MANRRIAKRSPADKRKPARTKTRKRAPKKPATTGKSTRAAKKPTKGPKRRAPARRAPAARRSAEERTWRRVCSLANDALTALDSNSLQDARQYLEAIHAVALCAEGA